VLLKSRRVASIIEVFGNCRVVEQVASGPLTDVYHAVQEPLARHVAIKALRPTIAPSSPFAAHLAREAELLAKLHHDNILELYDFVRTDSAMWLVLEYVDGVSLAEVIDKSERLTIHGALAVGLEIASALAHAHERGIIHRDIKPANLMVTADGVLKITDFGIARGGGATVTQTGQVMGTAQYVSPEQATGRKITPASDLYSLGVVAYECLAGMPPFAADTPIALALMHVREDAPPLPMDVPPAVRGLVSALMAKDPEDRPAGAHKVADQIHLLRESGGGDPDDADAATRAVPVGDAGTRVHDPLDYEMRSRGPATVAGMHRNTGKFVVALVCAAVLVGTAVFAAGTLWKGSGHTKLVDGNPAQPAGRPAPTRQFSRMPDSNTPTDRPEPSESVPSGPIPFPTPSFTTSPTTKPTHTIKPPTRTPTKPATSPPTSQDPTTPSSSPEGALGSEGRA
jgi:serine/threonine-protein kinase